ncbi:MAG: PAS domain S-box protein [Halobacteriaceae archaeon]
MRGDAGNRRGNSAKIQLVVEEEGDEVALTQLLNDNYEVITSPELESADCYIIDGQVLPQYFEALVDRKQRANPVFLPSLLIQRESTPLDIDDFETQAGDVVLVDELIHAPVGKPVLDRRIENLLARRRQSQSLQSEYQRMHRAVFSAGVAIYITDTEGNIEYVNPAFEEITGYSQEEAVGRNPRILNSGEMPDEYFEDLWNTVTAGEVWEEEVINRRKSGENYVAEQTIAPVTNPNGDIEGYVAIQQDITQRKEERQKLREFRQAVEASSELLAAIDMDWEFLFANEAYLEYHNLLGEPVENRSLQDVLGPDRFAEVEPVVRAAMDGERQQIEVTREHPERGERILDANIFPIRGGDGSIQGVGASMRDVTERKQRERHLQTLISNLPGIVYRCANERGWPMEMVRGRSEELTGYPSARIEADEVSWGEDIIHPEDRERVWQSVQEKVQADEPFELTYRIQTADNETRWVWERGRVVSPVRSDSPKLEGFITDISEQKQLERELRDSKERYESLFNSIQDAILVADTDRRIINCNPGFTEQFGYELDEIKGKPTSFVYESKEEFEEMGDEIRAHMDDPTFTYTINYQTKSGQVFPGETNVFYLKDADDEITGFIGVIRDVSDRQERLKQLKIFDRVLQHKFHNDMNVIEGNLDLAAETGGPDIKSYLETAQETATDLRQTVDKEREITKFLTDTPPRETFDIRATVEEAVDSVVTNHPHAEISVKGPTKVHARANLRFSRALEELLENAIIHSDSQSPTIQVRLRRSEDAVSVAIEDDGPPIPESERKLLADETELSPLIHHSGMGLWLVQLIVDKSDGTFDFEVTDDESNIVTVSLQRPLNENSDE